MEQGMKQQRGAALVIVLALLTGALVVGVSGMQSSLIDERLAGNYRASAQAQMNAEQAAAQAVQKPNNDLFSEERDTKGQSNYELLAKEGFISESQSKEEWQAALKKLRYDSDVLEEMSEQGGRVGQNLCQGDGNACFYFPLQVSSDNYMVAFGAVKNADCDLKDADCDAISQHVVLVEIDDNTNENINEDIATLLDTYLMASGSNSLVDGKNEGDGNSPDVTLDGPMHMEDLEQDFKNEGSKVKKGDNYEETRGDTVLGTRLPKFDLDEFEAAARKTPDGKSQKDVVKKDGDDACHDLPEDLGGKVYVCEEGQNLNNAKFSNGTVIFKNQVDFSGKTDLKNVNIVVTGNSGEITFIDDLFLDNVTVGAKDEIEYNWDGGSGTSKVVNSYFMSESNVQMDFNDDFVLDGGYFYANDESEIEFGDSPNAEPCGSIIGKDQAELYVDHIARFKQCAGGGMEVASWR